MLLMGFWLKVRKLKTIYRMFLQTAIPRKALLSFVQNPGLPPYIFLMCWRICFKKQKFCFNWRKYELDIALIMNKKYKDMLLFGTVGILIASVIAIIGILIPFTSILDILSTTKVGRFMSD